MIKPPRLTAHVKTLEGQGDGLRFGVVGFSDGKTFAFLYDLLSGKVRLYITRDDLNPKTTYISEKSEDGRRRIVAAERALHRVARPVAA